MENSRHILVVDTSRCLLHIFLAIDKARERIEMDGKIHLAALAGERAKVETGRRFAAHLALLVHLQ